jgi:hypothetical protein
MWYKKKAQKLTSKQVGLRYGFRSGLEEAIASELDTKNIQYKFEETKLNYVKPQKVHTYTPDFYLTGSDIYIETKGYFTSQDRQKMRLIKEQHPQLDIRFIFSNSKTRISKKSKTTYGMWCDKYGFNMQTNMSRTEWL